jgi:hypothetical protein
MRFHIQTFMNQYLSPGGRRADAVFSLKAEGGVTTGTRRVVGLIADKSGSMSGPKMDALKHALRVAVDQIPADAELFVIAFDGHPRFVLPLTAMDFLGRRAAHAAIQRIEADGGTVMSAALDMAAQVFRQRPDAVCQALMLTDGQNDERDEVALRDALRDCAGLFQADCRGVGTDWSPAQLRAIAEALLGTVQLVADPAAMVQDFRETLEKAMSRSAADVRLRLWMPRNARLVAIKQAFPTEIDLTAQLRPFDQRSVDVPLGAWAEGTQDYFATFDLAPLGLNEQMLVCRPSVVWRDAGAGELSEAGGNVTVTWTEDAGLSTRIDAQVAHYTGQAEKARAIQEGLEALERNDEATATLRLGRALALAEESGDAETTRRLREVVEPVGDGGGTLRLRRDAGKVAVMDLDVASTRTVRAKRD